MFFTPVWTIISRARVSAVIANVLTHSMYVSATRFLWKMVQKIGFFWAFTCLLHGDARAPPTLAHFFGYVWGVTKLAHRGSSRAPPLLLNLITSTGSFNSPRGQCRKNAAKCVPNVCVFRFFRLFFRCMKHCTAWQGDARCARPSWSALLMSTLA